MLGRCLAPVLIACAAAAPAHAQPRALVPRGTPLKVVVLPLPQPGERVPTRAQLDHTMRGVRRWFARVSHGRYRLRYAIAPPATGLGPGIASTQEVVRRAAAAGVDVAGAIPVRIEASRTPQRSIGNPASVQIRGRSWRNVGTFGHELGHALGLDHARAPTVCPRPFRPLACARHPRTEYEYGDTLDVMGLGDDDYGAYALAALGLAPVRDARAGVTRLRPLEAARPTLLRLRAAGQDWYVDTRRDVDTRDGRLRAPRGMAILRVAPRYRAGDSILPHTQRIPATDPARPCRAGSRACLARQIFGPGRTFTVPGAFRLRVLPGGRRVRMTWLDRTPPALAVTSARVVAVAGAGPQLELGVRTPAKGAGVLRVTVAQGGALARVDADTVPGLAVRGSGTLRVPLNGAVPAQVRAVDAAGHASAPATVDVATLPVATGASVTFDPPLGDSDATATPLAAGQVVTFSGRTDPALAGASVDVEGIGDSREQPAPLIGVDGSFAGSWRAPEAGLYLMRLRVPVAPLPDGLNFVTETFEGHFRA